MAENFPRVAGRSGLLRTIARNWRGYLYIAPAIILVSVFFIWPLLSTIWMSFFDWPLLGTPKWVGLQNYLRIPSDTRFLNAARFTAYYTVIVSIVIFLVAFGLAFFVESRRRMVGVYRTAFFLPVVVGLGSSSLIWVWLANVDSGILAPLLHMVGWTGKIPNLFAGFDAAFALIVVMIVWKTAGFNMVLLLTGLQSIPGEVQDAARVDGASWWQRFTLITLPLMRRTLALALILSVTGSILGFDQFYVVTGGGPQNRMVGIVHYIFNQSFVSFKLGYGAALSMLLLLVLVLLSIVQLKLLRPREAE